MNPSRRQRIELEQQQQKLKQQSGGGDGSAGKGRRAGDGGSDESGGYTVVIRGLTTDLAAIYRDALPRFLLPRVALQSDFSGAGASAAAAAAAAASETSDGKRASSQGGASAAGAGGKPTAAVMRPLQDVKVAFRVETLSAYVTVPEEEAKRALRTASVAQQEQQKKKKQAEGEDEGNADEDQEQRGETKRQKQRAVSAARTPSENLAALCNGRELFGRRCVAKPAESNHDQSSLVSVVATCSKAITAGAMTSVLKPVFAGFVSVLPAQLSTSSSSGGGGSNNAKSGDEDGAAAGQQQQQQRAPRSKRYRLVFANEKAAFEAKKLLDEFPAADDLRVAVVLNDQATRRYHEYVRAAENDVQDE